VEDALWLRAVVRGLVLCPGCAAASVVCMPLIFWGVWRGCPSLRRVGGVGWFPSRVGEVYIPRFIYSLTYRFPYTGNIYNNINNTLMVLSTNGLSVYKLT
jgi:hypothetical protein